MGYGIEQCFGWLRLWVLWVVVGLGVLSAKSKDHEATRYVESELLVQFRHDLEDSRVKDLLGRYDAEVVNRFEILPHSGLLRVSRSVELETAYEAFQKSDLTLSVSYNYVRSYSIAPDDPMLEVGAQWGLDNSGKLLPGLDGADIGAYEAWDIRTNAEEVIIGILDTGIRYTHEDLAGNMWVNAAEIPGNGIDDDENGYIDDIYGINTINLSEDPMDDNGHGTHVAGIAGAVGNNDIGISGVAWNVKLMALKFLDSSGDGNDRDAIECIEYALSHGVKVLNMSWGTGDDSETFKNVLQIANTAGMLVVASAGNAGNDNDYVKNYPASYDVPNVVAVTATDRFDDLASFASFGDEAVDIAAPGDAVYSTYNRSDSDYTQKKGTSMAAPHVSAAIALLLAEFPEESMESILDRLYWSVTQLEGLSRKCKTGGRLNLARALNPEIPAPLNDRFENAANFIEKLTVQNQLATLDDGEPNLHEDATGKSVWLRWTALKDGLGKIRIEGVGFETVVGVFVGDSINRSEEIVTHVEADKLVFSIDQGVEYKIVVDGLDGKSGVINLNASQNLSNDDFENRKKLVGIGIHDEKNNFDATAETNEPDHAGSEATSSLWWSWESPVEGIVNVSTGRSNVFDSVLAVYQEAESLSDLQLVAEDDDGGPGFTSDVSFMVKHGDRFALAVDGWLNGSIVAFGDVGLTVTTGENDNLWNARSIVENRFEDLAHNGSASKEFGEPNHADNQGGRSLWWSWTVGRSGTATISTIGSGFYTTLAVYQGEGFNDFVHVASNHHEAGGTTSSVDFVATRGERYLIAVDGYRGQSGISNGVVQLSGVVEELPGRAIPVVIDMEALSGVVGQQLSFDVLARGSPGEYRAVGLPEGLGIDGSTGSVSGTPVMAGRFDVRFEVENEFGVGEYSKTLDIQSDDMSPRIDSISEFKGGALGEEVFLNVVPSGEGNFSYQWYQDGDVVAGATEDELRIDRLSAEDAGPYRVVVSSEHGAVRSELAEVRVFDNLLANISTRGNVETGDRIMIAGFVVGGEEPRDILIRAVGPSLGQFDLSGTLPDPVAHLIQNNEIIASFDNWVDEANKSEIESVSKDLGAFDLIDNRDAARLFRLEPGEYTVFVLGKDDETGIALAEVYDVDRGENLDTRLLNISTRLNVTSGEGVGIGGFVIDGDESKRVLIRAVGPGLGIFNIGETLLADPVMQLYRGTTLLDRNDDWRSEGEASLAAAFEAVGAFGLEEGSSDSAMIRELEPGDYTVIIRDYENREGLCLFEVYELR